MEHQRRVLNDLWIRFCLENRPNEKERKRERERERETDRQAERQRDRETERERWLRNSSVTLIFQWSILSFIRTHDYDNYIRSIQVESTTLCYNIRGVFAHTTTNWEVLHTVLLNNEFQRFNDLSWLFFTLRLPRAWDLQVFVCVKLVYSLFNPEHPALLYRWVDAV